MNLLLSPHSDDECLFAAYTIMREKPLVVVVTDSDLQLEHGITAADRWEESIRGCHVLGVSVEFLGLQDRSLTDGAARLRERLGPYASRDWKRVYAPAIQGGHPDHDALGKVASSMFPRVSHYATYADGEFFTPDGKEVEPTLEEIDLKNKALDCYPSQVGLPANKQHFDAVRGKPEYLS
jgi:LmbE family N-acetylglucosaminyl deacetylase